jgi:dephospho-CoA kinase
MILIGLTGGIGMGKSTSARLLVERGVPVVDTDDLAREVVAPGQPALEELRAAFGPEIIGSDGALKREQVARMVFADPPRRRQLEGIVHPRIRQRWLKVTNQWRLQRHALGVVIIPLLYETDAAGEFGAVVCIACSAASQRQRLRSRQWSDQEIDQRLAAQWPVPKKMELADYVIWTEPRVETHAAQLDRVLRSLRSS